MSSLLRRWSEFVAVLTAFVSFRIPAIHVPLSDFRPQSTLRGVPLLACLS
jgi:hypothetical protein